jgi:hypothetical protein
LKFRVLLHVELHLLLVFFDLLFFLLVSGFEVFFLVHKIIFVSILFVKQSLLPWR